MNTAAPALDQVYLSTSAALEAALRSAQIDLHAIIQHSTDDRARRRAQSVHDRIERTIAKVHADREAAWAAHRAFWAERGAAVAAR